MYFFEVLVAIIIATGVFVLLWALFGALVTPVRCKAGGSLYIVLKIKGHYPEMEQAIDGLIWLKKTGVLGTQIIVADCGMDSETSEIAARIAEKHEKITVCDLKNLESVIVEEQ